MKKSIWGDGASDPSEQVRPVRLNRPGPAWQPHRVPCSRKWRHLARVADSDNQTTVGHPVGLQPVLWPPLHGFCVARM
jgi:hypothetical protein